MDIKSYNEKADLEIELCQEIVSITEKAIQKFGNAHILLSGGSTPLELYSLLGQQSLDFSIVKIGLVDERYVEVTSDLSNQKNIQEALNSNSTQKIDVLGMSFNQEDEKANIQLCNEKYQPFIERIDFCLLGMGDDGHTASIFPNDPASADLLNQQKPSISYSNAPSFPKKRISCNKAMLMNSKKVSLMLVGEKKIQILNTAMENRYPIAEFTTQHPNIEIYFSKK